MPRFVSIGLVAVYVVLAIHSRSAFAGDERETSRNGSDYRVSRDHRARSNNQGGVTVTNTPVVRDHRSPQSGVGPVVRDHRGAPIVRDHRAAPIVRDHRTPGKVVDPYATTRRPGTIPPVVRLPGRGDGKVLRDHRNAPIVRDHRQPVVHDHRTGKSSKPPIVIDPGRGDGKVVRDHRTPVVRDHRTPVVRDHRNSSNAGGGVVVKNTPVVRDHRSSTSNVGGVVRDHRN